jgi:hypothetical protein
MARFKPLRTAHCRKRPIFAFEAQSVLRTQAFMAHPSPFLDRFTPPSLKPPQRCGQPTAGAWYRAALACSVYALLAQVAALRYEVAAVVGPRVALLPVAAWAALVALVLRALALARATFPVLLRVWWAVSFALYLGIAYDDSGRRRLQRRRGLRTRGCQLRLPAHPWIPVLGCC